MPRTRAQKNKDKGNNDKNAPVATAAEESVQVISSRQTYTYTKTMNLCPGRRSIFAPSWWMLWNMGSKKGVHQVNQFSDGPCWIYQ